MENLRLSSNLHFTLKYVLKELLSAHTSFWAAAVMKRLKIPLFTQNLTNSQVKYTVMHPTMCFVENRSCGRMHCGIALRKNPFLVELGLGGVEKRSCQFFFHLPTINTYLLSIHYS